MKENTAPLKEVKVLRKTVTIMDRPVILKYIGRYVNEVDRMARATNIASFLTENWDALSSIGKSITSKKLRRLMVSCLGGIVKNAKGNYLNALPMESDEETIMAKREREGDDRAHGDTVGEHCLNLECRNTIIHGNRAKVILLNENNLQKLRTFLVRTSTEVLEVIV